MACQVFRHAAICLFSYSGVAVYKAGYTGLERERETHTDTDVNGHC